MKPESASSSFSQIEALLDQVLAADPAERTEILRRVTDEALRREVLELVELGERPSALLDRPLLALDAEIAEELAVLLEPLSGPGVRLGPWLLEDPLGSGGMGRVFAASRSDGAYSASAAIKVLRWELADPELVARFVRERQILADLDHPGIARLLDGGVSESGLPWLAMERVEGRPIDRHVEQTAASLEHRIELLVATCRAVQFAHSRLVIHRDIKPSNLIVDEDGAVKLLDFGIAKLADSELMTSEETATRGNAPMTVRWAAPEQLLGEDVSTATDVWALGVLAYALFSGEHPYAELPATGEGAALRQAVLRRDPEPPSRRLARLSPPSVPYSWKTLRPDLDNIVARAMAKDPVARYASAGEFADDLERFTRGEPVHAHAPSLLYVVRRFVARHRFAVSSAALVVVAMVGMAGWFAVRLAAERDRAQLEARKAEQVKDLVLGMFRTNDPEASGGREVTARELLDVAAERIDTDLRDQPGVRGEMKRVLGGLYYELGRYDEARQTLAEAVALARAPGSAIEPEELAHALDAQGKLLSDLGEYEAAEAVIREALRERLELFSPNSPEVAFSLNDLGLLLAYRGEYEEARDVLERAIAIYRARGDATRIELARALANLGLSVKWSGDFAQAEGLYREALAIRRAESRHFDPDFASLLDNLGVLLGQSGRFDESEAVMREALQLRRETLGEAHPDVTLSLNNLAALHRARGDLSQAEEMFEAALEANLATFGPQARRVGTNYSNLGGIQMTLGRYEEALPNLERALSIRRRWLGEEHIEIAISLQALSVARLELGDKEEAERLARRAVEIGTAVATPPSPQLSLLETQLGRVLLERRAYAEAIELLDRAFTSEQASLEERHPRFAATRTLLGLALLGARTREVEGLAHVREGSAVLAELRGEEWPLVIKAREVIAERAAPLEAPEPRRD